MKISVLTPSLNAAAFIERAIQSVRGQRYPHWEHIVVDGGSSDETLAILGRFPEVIVDVAPGSSQSAAMNRAFSLATGDLVVYLNADDTVDEGAFQTAVDFFTTRPACQLLVGRLRVKRNGTEFIQVPSTWLPRILTIEAGGTFPWNPVCYYYRPIVQQAVGPFPEANHYAMDYWFLIRALTKFRPHRTPAVLGTYHYHPASKSSDTDRARRALLDVRDEFVRGKPLTLLCQRLYYQAWRIKRSLSL